MVMGFAELISTPNEMATSKLTKASFAIRAMSMPDDSSFVRKRELYQKYQ
jgi:hypothetical protein